MTQKIRLLLLSSVPMVLVFLFALLFIAPKHIAGLSSVMPLLHLVPVFIWGVMHPRDISLFFLAMIGLVVDVATGLPLGFSALGVCAFFLLVRTQRKYIYREGFAAMWGYFSLLLMLLQITSWVGYAYFYGHAAPFGTLLLQWLFTALLYPLLHTILYPWVEKISHARYRLLHA